PFVSLFKGFAAVLNPLRNRTAIIAQLPLFAAGVGLWALGWALIALGIRRTTASASPPSEARGAALYPPLARYTDFHWGTLLAYGGGILLAALTLILLHTALVAGVGRSRPARGWLLCASPRIASSLAP